MVPAEDTSGRPSADPAELLLTRSRERSAGRDREAGLNARPAPGYGSSFNSRTTPLQNSRSLVRKASSLSGASEPSV
jgi:hypothetical protein